MAAPQLATPPRPGLTIGVREPLRPEVDAARPIRPNHVLAIVCVGIVLANLDLFIVNVALPDINRDFAGADLGQLAWVLNGYAIVYAALLVFFGRLSEGYRRDWSFLVGVALFTTASAACAAAAHVEMLVTFRVVQAAGAALLTPTSLGLLLAAFPAERRGHAVRTWTAIGGFAAALGPVVGGLLVTWSWRWIFLVNVPIGILALVIGVWKLPKIPGHAVRRPDAWGAALVTLGIRVCRRKATMTASSSTDRTVDLGSRGPVLRSIVEGRFFHFATVFGLIPYRLASCLRLS